MARPNKQSFARQKRKLQKVAKPTKLEEVIQFRLDRDSVIKLYELAAEKRVCLSKLIRCFIVERIAFGEHLQNVDHPTLQEMLGLYLESKSLRPATVAITSSLIHRCLQDWLTVPMSSITQDMVLARHRELPHRTMFNTSGETQANMAMRVLSRLFSFGIREGLVTGNPVRKLSENHVWYPESRRRTAIPDSKLRNWYEAVESLTDQAYRDWLLLMLFTGLRRSEAAGLQWSDVDLDQEILTIEPERTKNGQLHLLPLSRFVHCLLTRRMLETESEYVFPRVRENKPIISNWRTNRALINASGVEFVLHDLRRTFVTAAAKLSIPHHVIKKLVNHVGKADITERYIFCHVEDLREPMERIAERLLCVIGIEAGIGEWNGRSMPH